MAELDRSKLTPEQIAMLDQHEASQKTLTQLDSLEKKITGMSPTMSIQISNLEEQLKPIYQLLDELNKSVKTDKDGELSKSIQDLTSKMVEEIRAIDIPAPTTELKPNITVDAPQVSVNAPDVSVDLTRLEKLLKNDIPKAFEKAVKAIPATEIPETDNAPLTNLLSEISEKLSSIDTATRLKPQGPTTQQISGSVTADTELPAAATLADATANPTTPIVGAAMHGSNGTTWDRVRSGDTGDGGSGTGSLRSLNWLYNGANYDRARTVSSYNTVASATGMQGVIPLVYGVGGVSTTAGAMKSVDGLTDGFGGAGAPVHVNFLYNGSTYDRPRTATGSTGTMAVSPLAATAGGATPYKLVSAATTNATSVKGSAGNVYSVVATNVNASARFLKLYDKATAPTVGSDTPVQIYALPGNANGAGISLALSIPLTFSLGIAFAITGGIADSDTTAISANDVAVSLGYK